MNLIRPRDRRLPVALAALAVVLVLVGWQLADRARADGSDVAGHLGQAGSVVGGLSGSIGPGGGYGGLTHAGSVPFLGDRPGSLLPGLFNGLGPLSGFNGFAPADGDPITVVTDKVEAVDVSLGPNDQLVDRTYTCGAAACDPSSSKVQDLTAMSVRLAVGGSSSGKIDFTSLGLPSLGFLPEDGQQLDVNLSWSVNARLTIDGQGLRLAPVANEHELTLGATISLPTGTSSVDMGALVIEATTTTKPTFSGSVVVDVDETGAFTFGFGPDTGFAARWHLETKDSPLMGVAGDLDIAWDLTPTGVDPSGLRIKLENITIKTSEFVGEDLQEIAGGIRQVTHPIRTVASPLLEPIPGLSDLADALGVGEVTMLHLMEAAGTDPDLRRFLEKLALVDDALGSLSGGGDVNLGSIELVGGDALVPKDQPLRAAALASLQSVIEECEPCKDSMDAILGTANLPGVGGMQFDFPVLRDPATLGGLLLGRDVELFTFDTGRLGFDEDLNIPLARLFIFSVKIEGPVEATVRFKGGVDTRGISDALASGDVADVLNGLYLQNPGDGPVVKLFGDVRLVLSAEVVDIGGGPKIDVALTVPPSIPDGKLRPALFDADIGCQLLEAPEAKADFGVHVTATFDYVIDEYVEVLASHTFLTEDDLCEPAVDDTPVAEYDGNGNVIINTGTARKVPAGEPDTIKVFMRRAESSGAPTHVVVTGNGNKVAEFPADQVTNVRYDSAGDDRPVLFRAVRADGQPFEKNVFVTTGDGADDVVVDSTSFGLVSVGGGPDAVTVTAGGNLVSGGEGDDVVTGGEGNDVLGGGGGHDTVTGAEGFDILSGDDGDDIVMDSSPEGGCLSGGAGDDQVVGGPGNDDLNGDESLCGEVDPGPDPEDAGADWGGRDVIITGGGADRVLAGNGGDEVRLDATRIAAPDDERWDAGSVVHGNGGDDLVTTGNGPDLIHGGPGDDEIDADGGPVERFAFVQGGNDRIFGGLGEDTIFAGPGGDVVSGDDGTDTCAPPIVGQPTEADTDGAADEVHGGAGPDQVALEAGDDIAHGDDGADTICGHAGEDEIDGGGGDDEAFGGTGADAVGGGDGGDGLFGNAGIDDIDGGDDVDLVVGGSSQEKTSDDGDTIHGGDGADIAIGDNGSLTDGQPSVPIVFDLFALTQWGGGDTIDGDDGDDLVFGGVDDDTIHGNEGDDHLEGNNGDDGVHGDGGQDDIIGGTTPVALPGGSGQQTAADVADGGETILSGGDERDVIIGDNGSILRPGGTDPATGAAARTVVVLDRDRVGAALAAVSGPDHIEGGAERDRLFGQGGGDYVEGNDADDHAEGNQGADRLEGNDGEDDLLGGSSFLSAPGAGDPDTGDRIAGGAGADVLLGDNGQVVRSIAGVSSADWDTVANSWLGPAARRSVTLLDKDASTADRFGPDVLSGGAGEDVAFGQDGADSLFGGSHDDYLEGNGDADLLHGDQVAPPTGHPHESGLLQLDGAPGPDGQDDQIGGSSWARSVATNGAVTGQRDAADELHGDGAADVQLGDNGRISRRASGGTYLTYSAATGKATVVRQAAPPGEPPTALPARFDVGAPASAGVWGDDVLHGDGGDDVQLAGDGDDTLHGGADDDDMYGELGDDRMSGDAGEDAMLGDRGVITNRLTARGDTFAASGPLGLSFTPYAAHPLDRRVDTNDDGDGAPLQSPGLVAGGQDLMRGGLDHDSLHGADGNDLGNGDGGGDYVFGGDGADVLWGGRGRICLDSGDTACNEDRGSDDAYVDYLFGGHGLTTDPVTGGADLLDFRPRPGVDPDAWLDATDTEPDDLFAEHQHHQGVDWIYGGWDRDVMQADLADNGPHEGDRLIDWTGAYNLYTHCPSAYGGFTDIRQFSPSMKSFLERLAHSLGAGRTLTDMQDKSTSGGNELALVTSADVRRNSGSAYPDTPGHFDDFSCAP